MAARILMADDSNTIQKVIKIALSHFSVTIDEAMNIAELDIKLADKKYELLIVDSNLAGIDHLRDLFDHLNRYEKIPTIILKGSYDSLLPHDFSKYDFHNILKKPFSTEELQNAIENAGITLKGRQASLDKEKERQKSAKKPNASGYNIASSILKSKDKDSVDSHLISDLLQNKEVMNKIMHQVLIEPNGNFKLPFKEMIENIVNNEVRSQVQAYCSKNAKKVIEEFLSEELDKLSSKPLNNSDI